MSVDTDLVSLQIAHHRRLLALRDVAGNAITRTWDKFAGVTDADLERFVQAAAPIADGVRMETARLATGYASASDAAAGFPTPLPTPPAIIRNGTPTAEVYGRSIIEVRRRLSDGAEIADALSAGRARAVQTIRTDTILANRAANAELGERRPHVVGYRRTLTGASCALCATASTQRYRTANLQAIHANCDCGIAPIYARHDPGSQLNEVLVQDLKEAAFATDQRNYWDGPYLVDQDGTIRYRKTTNVLDDAGNPVRGEDGRIKRTVVPGEPVVPKVQTHGELGPVLTDSKHAFAGPDDIAA